jgi:RNA polymerase sigma-70 factor, ECF subfamily
MRSTIVTFHSSGAACAEWASARPPSTTLPRTSSWSSTASWGGFRGESSAQTWLYGIARHVASNHQRRDQRKQAPLEPLVSEPTHPDPGPLERAEDAEAAAFVATFVSGLGDKKRDLFILAVLEEMTIPEVAAALAIPLNTAYTRLRSVRADFERALGSRRS